MILRQAGEAAIFRPVQCLSTYQQPLDFCEPRPRVLGFDRTRFADRFQKSRDIFDVLWHQRIRAVAHDNATALVGPNPMDRLDLAGLVEDCSKHFLCIERLNVSNRLVHRLVDSEHAVVLARQKHRPSVLPYSSHGIDSRSLPCRRVASQHHGGQENDDGRHYRRGIVRLHLEQKGRDQSRRA
jgi:hypothetical protein